MSIFKCLLMVGHCQNSMGFIGDLSDLRGLGSHDGAAVQSVHL